MSKKSKNYKKTLAQVLHALADLSDKKGSSLSRIFDRIQTSSSSRNAGGLKPKIPVAQVKRALKYGVNAGILKLSSGKYRSILPQHVCTNAPSSVPKKNREEAKRKGVWEENGKRKRRKKRANKKFAGTKITKNRKRKQEGVKGTNKKNRKLFGKAYLKKVKTKTK